MVAPDDLAAAQQAFAAGYRDADERMHWGMANPGMGIACGWQPEPDATGLAVVGLGYDAAPDPVPVYSGAQPGLIPSVLPVPLGADLSAGPALTGATHGGWSSVADGHPAGSSVIYAGVGDLSAPRRSLWSRLTRKGR